MVVQFETGLHAIIVVELDECKAAAFVLRVVLLCGHANHRRGVFLEVFGERLLVGGVWQVACKYIALAVAVPYIYIRAIVC